MMAKKQKILMLTDGNVDNASSRIRAFQYIPLLEESGFTVYTIARIPVQSKASLWRYIIFPLLKRYFFVKRFIAIKYFRWDFVYIQRTLLAERLLKTLKSRNIPILFDFDDAIYINPQKPENRDRTGLMIRYSDQVIVSTPYLEEFCRLNEKDPCIIPSPVETDRIRPSDKSNHQMVTIGWMGSVWTTDFLKIVENPLRKLAKIYPFQLLAVGARTDYVPQDVTYISYPWKFEEEDLQISKMDIGIMPLPDTEWSRSKGGYKLLQYMSGGIPCVASPVGINSTIIKDGINGFLAPDEEQWYCALEKLLTNPSLRIKLGKKGRIDAVEIYSREVCFSKLLSIFRTIAIVKENKSAQSK